MTIKPSFRAFPITLFFILFFIFISFKTDPTGGAAFFIFLFVVLPLALILLFSVKGSTYTVDKNKLIIKTLFKPLSVINLDDVSRVKISPSGIRAGSITFYTPAGESIIKNIASPMATAKKMGVM